MQRHALAHTHATHTHLVATATGGEAPEGTPRPTAPRINKMSFAVACPSLTSSTPLALMEPGCFKFVLSKTLGYGIVAGSAGVKLPQVAAILRAANVSGLAGSTILIEMISSISSVAYFAALGYPFSTWGESCFILLQQAIITALYFHYTGGLLTGRFAITASAGGALGVALYQRSVPDLALPAPLCDALGVSRCSLTCTQLAGSLPVVLMLVGVRSALGSIRRALSSLWLEWPAPCHPVRQSHPSPASLARRSRRSLPRPSLFSRRAAVRSACHRSSKTCGRGTQGSSPWRRSCSTWRGAPRASSQYCTSSTIRCAQRGSRTY